MNTVPPAVSVRRRQWPWVLGFCLAPFAVLGAMAISFLTLDRDAAVLRKQIMAGTNVDWQTKIQLSVGRLTIGAVRAGLAFVDNKNVADARCALDAVRAASVGVYQFKRSQGEAGSRETVFAETDAAMAQRGWSRLVGVTDKNETVLVYAPARCDAGGSIDICLAVVNPRELVVASATVDAAGLAALVEKHAGDALKRSLKLTQFADRIEEGRSTDARCMVGSLNDSSARRR